MAVGRRKAFEVGIVGVGYGGIVWLELTVFLGYTFLNDVRFGLRRMFGLVCVCFSADCYSLALVFLAFGGCWISFRLYLLLCTRTYL